MFPLNGFATVLYLRLVYFPFTPMNFGMGLTKVRFWDYFSGTALDIVVGTLFKKSFWLSNSRSISGGRFFRTEQDAFGFRRTVQTGFSDQLGFLEADLRQ